MDKGYTVIEILIIILILSIILSITVNIKVIQNEKDIKNVIIQVNKYTNAIKTFKKIYGYLPGDVKKTQIFQLSNNNTDGNQNGLIEDKNQSNKIEEKYIKGDGEVINLWLHLYNSKFLKQGEDIFPYMKPFETAFLIFSDKKYNYYHFSIDGINKNNEIKTINNITPYQAYVFDKKFDDGLPGGNIFPTSGNRITKNFNSPHRKCSTKYEYMTIFKQKTCQLVMKIDF